jgi:hypothetical protein
MAAPVASCSVRSGAAARPYIKDPRNIRGFLTELVAGAHNQRYCDRDVDIFIATKHFRRSSEYVPLCFSIAAAMALAAVCAAILIVQALVGIAGFLLHARGMFHQSAGTLVERVLNEPAL